MNRYTLLFMALAAVAGHYLGMPIVVGLVFAWVFLMVWRDAELTWGDKSVGQILEERRRRKDQP